MQFTPRQIRALSAEADVCENTVKRRLSGLPTRPSTGHRIEKAATDGLRVAQDHEPERQEQGGLVSLLSVLQAKLLGPLRSEQEQLDEAKTTLLQELEAIDRRKTELGEQIDKAQSEEDRAVIPQGLATVNTAIEAARRERQRLDLANEKNKAKLRENILERFTGLEHERAGLMVSLRQCAQELGALERQGRTLWMRALQVMERGRQIRTEEQRLHGELLALGVKHEELPEAGEFPSENVVFAQAIPDVRKALSDIPDVGTLEDGARTFLGYFFEKIARRIR